MGYSAAATEWRCGAPATCSRLLQKLGKTIAHGWQGMKRGRRRGGWVFGALAAWIRDRYGVLEPRQGRRRCREAPVEVLTEAFDKGSGEAFEEGSGEASEKASEASI